MPPLRVFELRNYTLHPGQREVLIDLFESAFVESQEALGARVLATFRNLDDPNRFVWVRGFADMESRRAALDGFCTSPVWQANRTAANATIVDSDDVLLLRQTSGSLARDAATRPPVGAAAISSSLIVATTYFLRPHGDEDFAPFFARDVAPHLAETGADALAAFATEHSANSYPRLPVRENESVVVTFMRFESPAAHAAHAAALAAWPAWRRVDEEFQRRTITPTQTLRLQPAARSLLR